MKKLLSVSIFCFILFNLTVSYAGWTVFERAHQIYNYRGIIYDINYKHNRVTLEDYNTKLRQRFVASHKSLDGLKVGDEVKIYFRPGTNELLSIKKMTPVKYIKGKQNNGFLFKSETSEHKKWGRN